MLVCILCQAEVLSSSNINTCHDHLQRCHPKKLREHEQEAESGFLLSTSISSGDEDKIKNTNVAAESVMK